MNKTTALDLMNNRVEKNYIAIVGNRTNEDINEIESEVDPYREYR